MISISRSQVTVGEYRWWYAPWGLEEPSKRDRGTACDEFGRPTAYLQIPMLGMFVRARDLTEDELMDCGCTYYDCGHIALFDGCRIHGDD